MASANARGSAEPGREQASTRIKKIFSRCDCCSSASPSGRQCSLACCDRVPTRLPTRGPCSQCTGIAREVMPARSGSPNKGKAHEILRSADRDSDPLVHRCCCIWDAQAAHYRRPSSRSRGELASLLSRGSACESTKTTSARPVEFFPESGVES
jgi:hypothetical protein